MQIQEPGTENLLMSKRRFSQSLILLLCLTVDWQPVAAQDIDSMREDQITRLRNYVLAAIQPSGLVRDSVVLSGSSFHPATPDAAGFALVALSAFDHLDKLPDAEQRVVNILNAYAGHTAGVHPDRSADGHFLHFIDINNGSDPPGWDDSYTPIGSALLVAGAQFAKRHFTESTTIAGLADELTRSVDFNAAIHPSLDGRIFLDMTKTGGGAGGAVRPWNEFMLVESLALRQPNNDRAEAVKDLWLDVANLPKKFTTLTDSNNYAPAFWVQQMHFFNGDFRQSEEFEQYFVNQQTVDKAFSSSVLKEEYRYGFTAGVVPAEFNNGSPYHADSISNHPGTVFSPESVAAWGDLDTLLTYYQDQPPTSDPRYKYGMVRVSADQASWVPNDAGLVDHLFLLFGLVESLDPNFFADRLFPAYIPGDFDNDDDVDGEDLLVWQRGQDLGYDATDLMDWQANFGQTSLQIANTTANVPEPGTFAIALTALLLSRTVRPRRPNLPL